MGLKTGIFNRYVSTAQSGQRLTVLAEPTRTTTAVEPFITHIGSLKTS
jgi:hypothetical protein